ncbi:MAG: TIGR03943 family putative permease subunit [Fimbriiglobus sp.]
MDHIGEHDHDHPHGHDHDHGHNAASEFYLEQLLTLLVCGAMAVTSILMWMRGGLDLLLVAKFHSWVLYGGIALLVVTVLRGVALWSMTSSKNPGHGHEGHVHGPDCDHDHDGHSHMAGGIYLKAIPFAVPVLLFVMGLPNATFSKEWIDRRLGNDVVLGEIKDVAEKGGDLVTLDFAELNMAAFDPAKREAYEGKRIRVRGQLSRKSEKEYTLFKLKMTCCAADVIPLKAVIRSSIVIPQSKFQNQEWVWVEGVLQFVEVPEQKHFLPVIRIGRDGQLGLTPTASE